MGLLDWILVAVTVVLCGAAFLLFLYDLKNHPLKSKKEINSKTNAKNDEKNEITFKSVCNKSVIIYSVIMSILVVAITFALCLIYRDNTFLFNLKRVALLSMIWPIAFIDFKSYRIPNEFIILGISYRVVILALELIFSSGVWKNFLTEIIASAALFLASFLCGLFIKNAIGFGDVKLFLVMGLLLGLKGVWSAIFLSLIVSFIISIYVLVTKRKGRKDSIPFGPAIVIGTFLSVFLTGM